MQTFNSKDIKAIILGVIVVLCTNIVIGWSDPFCSPPGCGKSAPINATSDSQALPGSLLVGNGAPITSKGYFFSAIKGLSYFDGVVAKTLYFEDGSASKTGKFLMSNDSGIASWQDYTPKVNSTSIVSNSFSINVVRKTTKSLTIPATYQYCAISQLGPNYADSDKSNSQCSVNQNSDNTWTLYGVRADDPDFICKAQCFYSPEITSVIRQ